MPIRLPHRCVLRKNELCEFSADNYFFKSFLRRDLITERNPLIVSTENNLKLTMRGQGFFKHYRHLIVIIRIFATLTIERPPSATLFGTKNILYL